MNQLGQILAFALLHANMDDREELSSRDVLAAVYVFAAELLYARSNNHSIVDGVIGSLCDISEPLWLIRMRYFSELYISGSGMRASGNQENQFSKLLKDPALLSSEDPVKALLTKLCDLDDEVGTSLQQLGVCANKQ